MSETGILQLPLVQAAQAQKHITVNEGLRRLDGMVQLRLQSLTIATPPLTAQEGECWYVPNGAVNDWAGHEGEIATFANGGWIFTVPQVGWTAWDVTAALEITFDGTTWQGGYAAISASGAGLRFQVLEFDHVISAGATDSTSVLIPANAMVFGVTGRVTDTITGTLSSWELGADGSSNRFGSGLGLVVSSFVRGVLGSPLTGYSAMPLDLTATGGDFAGGTVRLAVHYAELTLPSV